MALGTITNLPASLQVQYWERKLRQESLLYDAFTGLSGTHSTEKRVSVSNEIFMKLEGSMNEARKHTVVLQKALSGTPTEGSTASQVGNEENLSQKSFDVYYNDVSNAVLLQEYGIEAKNKDYWGIFEQITPLLSIWGREIEGKYIREALLERYSSNLTAAPHSFTQEWNSNIAIPLLATSAYPAYDPTLATYTEAIGDALTAADGAGTPAATPKFLLQIEEYASADKNIEPVMIGGKETYICVLPSPQCRYIKDPTVSGNLGDIWQISSGLTKEEFTYPGVIGRFGRLLVCEDSRYPTITLGGVDGAWTLTPKYKLPGRGSGSDPRDKSATAWQVGYLLGNAAIAKLEAEAWHWEMEYEKYDKFAGKGIFASTAYNLVEWDDADNPTASTRQNDGSLVLLMQAPPA